MQQQQMQASALRGSPGGQAMAQQGPQGSNPSSQRAVDTLNQNMMAAAPQQPMPQQPQQQQQQMQPPMGANGMPIQGAVAPSAIPAQNQQQKMPPMPQGGILRGPA